MGAARFSWAKREKSLDEIRRGYHITEVYEWDMKPSKGPLYSEGFSCCHALAFLDGKGGTAILAHLNSRADPGMLMEGTAGFYTDDMVLKEVKVVKPSDIYADPGKVSVKHLYHHKENLLDLGYMGEEDIEKALNDNGFVNVEHIKLYNGRDEPYFRDVVVDPVAGCVYVFPRPSEHFMTIPFF
jgi:hypothetical protein